MGTSIATVPPDRSTRNTCVGFCRNPKCRVDGNQFKFEVRHHHIVCPKCGANQEPMVGLITLIHFLVQVDGGPLRGQGGIPYALACDEKRAYLATISNDEAATGDIDVANCPQCLENAAKLGIKPTVWTPEPIWKPKTGVMDNG